jgi:hypothetical protein
LKPTTPILPLLALTVALSACAPTKQLTQALLSNPTAQSLISDPTKLAGLVKNFGKIIDTFHGKLSTISTTGLTADTFKDVVALTEGLKSGKEPVDPGFTTLSVKERKAGSALNLLGAFSLLDTEQDTVGTGGNSPETETRDEAANLKEASDTPIFESASEDPTSSHYGLLDVPSSVDLRDKMPPIRNQGHRGTCVLFSTAGYLDYMYQNDANAPIKHASPEFMNWSYNLFIKSKVSKLKPELWQDLGSVHALYHSILREGGMADVVPDKWPFVPPQQGYISEEECPYDGARTYDDPSADFHEAAVKRLGADVVTKIENHEAFTAQGARFFKLRHTLATFKATLAALQPIQTSIPIYGPDWATLSPDQPQIPELSDEKVADKANIGYHSVLIVGYKDDASAPGGGWFIMRNSWGERWAEKGYGYLSYDFMRDYSGLSYAAEPYGQPFQATYSINPPSDDANEPDTSSCTGTTDNPDCVPSPSVPLNAIPKPNVIVAPDLQGGLGSRTFFAKR